MFNGIKIILEIRVLEKENLEATLLIIKNSYSKLLAIQTTKGPHRKQSNRIKGKVEEKI